MKKTFFQRKLETTWNLNIRERDEEQKSSYLIEDLTINSEINLEFIISGSGFYRFISILSQKTNIFIAG